MAATQVVQQTTTCQTLEAIHYTVISVTYDLWVTNLGQKATQLVITDVLPPNVTYVSGGSLVSDTVRWDLAVLGPGQRDKVSFQVGLIRGRRWKMRAMACAAQRGSWRRGQR